MSRRNGRALRHRPDHHGGRPRGVVRQAHPKAADSALPTAPHSPELKAVEAPQIPAEAAGVSQLEPIAAPSETGPSMVIVFREASGSPGAIPVEGDGSVKVSHDQPACTTAQLRRFIKSRAYVPLHEIRRRFAIATEDDDVTGVEIGTSRLFVGLPSRESEMLGELLRGGEIGYELQLDPVAPVLVGVYPMRPVSRS